MQFARARRRLGGSRDDGAPTVKNENDSLRFRARAKSSRFAALEFLSTGSRPHPKHSPNNDTISPSTIFTSRSSTNSSFPSASPPRHVSIQEQHGTYSTLASPSRVSNASHVKPPLVGVNKAPAPSRRRSARIVSLAPSPLRTHRADERVGQQPGQGRTARAHLPGHLSDCVAIHPYSLTVLSSSGYSG